jgi:hypothetical protein
MDNQQRGSEFEEDKYLLEYGVLDTTAWYLCVMVFQINSFFSPSEEDIQRAANVVEELNRQGKSGGLVTWRIDESNDELQLLEVWERRDSTS